MNLKGNSQNMASIELQNQADSHGRVRESGLVLPKVEESQQTFEAYPEGGFRAYTVCLGAWFALLPASGILTTTGALQAYLLGHQLKDHSEAEVGWIFSVFAFLFFFGGILGGAAFDRYGLRVLLIPGSVGLTASIVILAYCKEYYQFMLSFSILGGISGSLIWTSTIATIGHWFSARRGIATGLATTAGGFGGIMFPLLIESLMPKLGYKWTICVLASISAFASGVGILLMSTRISPSTTNTPMFDMGGFKDASFSLTVAAIFMIDLAVVLPPAYLTSYALDHGFSSTLSYQLLAFLNATTVIGRGLPGFIADKWGRFNVMIISSILSTIMILSLWMFAQNNLALLVTFTVLFGIFSGTAYSLTPVCIAQLCQQENYATRYGTAYGLVSFATLIGNPLAGAILGPGKNYKGLIGLCGGAYAASAVLFVLARGKGGGWKFLTVF